jgi:TetR/AcrR family transcriptional regulator, mexJK operon transcriptional repressor
MRIKPLDRQQKYIDTARQLFFTHGYAKVSMHMIATTAGGSKTTLYNYFASKEAVFRAFVLETGKEKFSRLVDARVNVEDINSTLCDMATAYLSLAWDPDVRRLNQLVHAESPRQKELALVYHDLSHTRTLNTMAWTFEGLVFHQSIRHAAPKTLAIHFKALLDSIALNENLAAETKVTDTAVKQAVQGAVEVFLYGYQPRGAQAA